MVACSACLMMAFLTESESMVAVWRVECGWMFRDKVAACGLRMEKFPSCGACVLQMRLVRNSKNVERWSSIRAGQG